MIRVLGVVVSTNLTGESAGTNASHRIGGSDVTHAEGGGRPRRHIHLHTNVHTHQVVTLPGLRRTFVQSNCEEISQGMDVVQL